MSIPDKGASTGDRTFKRALVVWLLAAAAVAGTLYWVRLAIPVKMADAPSGRIACVSYSPYYKEGEAPFDAQLSVSPVRIENDLRALSRRFDCVRTYSVGKGMAEVPTIAGKLGMKVLLGVWLNRNEHDNEEEMRTAVELARGEKEAGSNTIQAIIVGNEVLQRGELPQAKLAEHIRRMRDATGLPVTYAEGWGFWPTSREIEKAVDFITIHILPYWEDKPVPVGNAVEYVRDIHAQIRAAFPGREILIGETGWPSAGRQRWGAVPSIVNQARFIREFLVFAQQSGIRYNVIEAFDQPWKRLLEGTVGGYWGIFDSHGEPKFAMNGPVAEDARWIFGLAAGCVLALLFVGGGLISKSARNAYSVTVLALAGYTTGAVLAAQLRHMLFSNRSSIEWAMTGAWTLLALATAAWIAGLLARQKLDFAVASIADFAVSQGRARWLGVVRAIWLFSLVVVDLPLVFDERYRDFPTLLFAPAVAGFGLLALATKTTRVQAEEKLMAASIAAMGVAILAIESPVNTSAVIWVGFGFLSTLSVAASAGLSSRAGGR